MKRSRWATALFLLGGLTVVRVAESADDFNEERLVAGRLAYQQKKYVEAIDQFRVAAFGSLDRPVVLSECLARLALAQSGAGRISDVDATLNRFLEVERRFGPFAKANLEPETRSEFRALLTRRIPSATIPDAPPPTVAKPGEKRTPQPTPKSSS